MPDLRRLAATGGFLAVLFAMLLGLPALSANAGLEANPAELEGVEFRLAPLDSGTAFELAPFDWEPGFELAPFDWEFEFELAPIGDDFQLAPIGA